MVKESVLFVGDNSRWSELAADHLRNTYDDVAVILWDHGERKPELIRTWSGDRIFCFKADLVVPPETLARAARTAINFHPSIPQYPGIGGYDYVIAARGSEFGVTCHHMVSEIDAGDIIEVQRFPVHSLETVAVLRDRAAAHCLLMFYNIVYRLRTGAELPVSDEKWGPVLYTRAMLKEFYREQSIEAQAIGY
jgi:methionyl-tRNA formyltransferase